MGTYGLIRQGVSILIRDAVIVGEHDQARISMGDMSESFVVVVHRGAGQKYVDRRGRCVKVLVRRSFESALASAMDEVGLASGRLVKS